MLIKPNTMWPALIFAARRNDRVSGRTAILVVSIIIRNGFNHLGAPSGNKWAIDALGALEYDDKMNDIHIGRPNDKGKIKWLDKLNVYGVNPIKFTKIIDENNGLIAEFVPFSEIENVRLICSFINVRIKYNDKKMRDGNIQKKNWTVIIINIFLNSRSIVNLLIDINLKGSKAEKMSNIN